MLLRNKKVSDPNEGKWIGIGGKFEEGETPDECMLREVREETGLELSEYHFHGIIEFRSDEWEYEDMYLYTAHFPERESGTLEEPRPEDADKQQILSEAKTGAGCTLTKNGPRQAVRQDMPVLPECREGTLRWIPKDEIMNLNLWEGDRIFLKELLEGREKINMRLSYSGDKLTQVERL